MLTHCLDKVVGFFLERPGKEINVNAVMLNYNTFFTHVPPSMPLCRSRSWDSKNKTHELKQQDLYIYSLQSFYTECKVKK